MDRGIYAASSAGLVGIRKLDTVAQNLANVNTVGFKGQRLVTRQQEFSDTLASTLQNTPKRVRGDQERVPGVMDIETLTDFSPGPISYTGNSLNVALQDPKDFFVVQTDKGPQYTRAGNFQLNSEGQLVTVDGKPVLGEGGPIVANGADVHILANRTVMVGKENAGTLRVVKFDNPEKLIRNEGTRFTPPPGVQPKPSEGDVVTGSLEMSNVAVMQSMVDMINAHKSFESYAKSVQTISELNETAMRTYRAG